MSKFVDETDGLPATEVGEWAKQKHQFLRRYLDISRTTRQKFLKGRAKSATFIDLFCGPGRARIKETGEWIDGSAITAWKISRAGGAPFSDIYVADIDHKNCAATTERLKNLGAPVQQISGSAVQAAIQVARSINPYGLHFSFIDPFSLGALDFRIIQSLASLKRIDMLIHVSKMDLQRNLKSNITADESAFDRFAPGWRNEIDIQRPQQEVRRLVVEYWRELVANLGIRPSTNMKLISGSSNQPLYWLLLAAKHELAEKFWKLAADTDPQTNMFE